MIPNPWVGGVGIVCLLGLFAALLRWYQRHYAPDPEIVRKLAHMTTGLVSLTLPWVFHSPYPVLLLAGAAALGLLAARRVPFLKRGFAGIVDGVERESAGDVYFPLSVGALFYLSAGNIILYCVPLIILTFADAFAALAGVRYGQHRYETTAAHKSAEGSLALFTIAFLGTHIPVLLFTDVSRSKSLLIGLMLGLTAMLLEAIAWRGLDNIFIPVGGFVLLRIYLGLSERALAERFAFTLLFVVLVLLYRARTTLYTGALLAGAFIAYVIWAVAGWSWLLTPGILFLAYARLSPRAPQNMLRIHGIRAVFCVTSAGLLWLFASQSIHRPELIYPYCVGFGCHLAMIGMDRLGFDYPACSGAKLVVLSSLPGWLLVLLGYCTIIRTVHAVLLGAISIACIAVAATLFYKTQPQVRDCPVDAARWLRQAAVAALGSLMALIPLYSM